MSLKKDNFNSIDKNYMQIAINLANNHKGYTGSNPSVGCVIVKNKKIISFGNTNINGRPHAEIIALSKNKKQNEGSDMYLTLEPCTHFGKTAPCTNAILKAKIKKVIFSAIDSDTRTKNKAKKILNLKNIKTKTSVLKNESKIFYKNYNYSKKKNYPYVTCKIACSSPYKILKSNKFITNNHSRNVTHIIRSQNQGILTSYKTVNNDNPLLNCRISGLENFSPAKFIIDKDLKLKKKLKIFKNKKVKNYIFHSSSNLKKIKYFINKGQILIKVNLDEDKYLNLNDIFKKIYNLGINNLLIESGPLLINKILKLNLINEFYLFKSEKKINSTNSINIAKTLRLLKNKFKLKKNINTYLDKDKLIHYY